MNESHGAAPREPYFRSSVIFHGHGSFLRGSRIVIRKENDRAHVIRLHLILIIASLTATRREKGEEV